MSSKECPSIERYEYKSLDYTTQQIRLIRLLEPTVDDDRMCLHIDIFDMSEAPPYTALSYVWGLPTSLYDVYIKDEKLEDTKLQVRENLYDFLVEFRVQEETEHSDQYLWIDQLAIDQATNLERNHQVQMMSDIYSNAESVIVWLGKAQSDYEAARTYQKTGHHEAFTAILHNNYFDRLWVMQEFLLAK
ncbi:HET-domain-containing protein, partial [Ophiobolus disseminans]